MTEVDINGTPIFYVSSRVESEAHPMVKRLVKYRYDYAAEPLEEIVGSGALNQYRNGWFTGIALAAEFLIDDGIITEQTHYRKKLNRFMKRYMDVGKGLKSTRRTAKEVNEGNLLLDLMLDQLYPQHIYFDQVQKTRILHRMETKTGNPAFHFA